MGEPLIQKKKNPKVTQNPRAIDLNPIRAKYWDGRLITFQSLNYLPEEVSTSEILRYLIVPEGSLRPTLSQFKLLLTQYPVYLRYRGADETLIHQAKFHLVFIDGSYLDKAILLMDEDDDLPEMVTQEIKAYEVWLRGQIKIEVGMLFNNNEEAEEFYKTYAHNTDFLTKNRVIDIGMPREFEE